MQQQSLASSWKELLFFALLGGVLALGFSLLRPLEFSSSARLLVIQKVASIDAYSAIKSVETITDGLSELVHTTSFYDRVFDTDIRINKAYFSNNERDRRRQWDKMVETHTSRGNGFLRIAVYHPDKREARKIVEAITQVLMTQGSEYLNAEVQIKSVDSPLESRFPVKPNLPVNALGGMVFGTLVGILYALNSQRSVQRRSALVLAANEEV